jgi:hypothetical protein
VIHLEENLRSTKYIYITITKLIPEATIRIPQVKEILEKDLKTIDEYYQKIQSLPRTQSYTQALLEALRHHNDTSLEETAKKIQNFKTWQKGWRR